MGLARSGKGSNRRVALAIWEWTSDLLAQQDATEPDLDQHGEPAPSPVQTSERSFIRGPEGTHTVATTIVAMIVNIAQCAPPRTALAGPGTTPPRRRGVLPRRRSRRLCRGRREALGRMRERRGTMMPIATVNTAAPEPSTSSK
ncbi:hypothetical protein Amsp01_044050 [Amycolatopsis sp. NBRC 101858]|nr:hypothetical protein Amsp01_044050 [Amycolatopsis sp. NBRC 101858]